MDKDKHINRLKERVSNLEVELKEAEENSILSKFSTSEKKMINIISIEIGRLEKDAESTRLDKDEIKKFDTLVKDYVALRGKIEKILETSDDLDDDAVADLISIVNGSVDG